MAERTEGPASRLGRGLRIVGGDLTFRGSDLALVSDTENLMQGLQAMIETPFGTDLFNVAYGFDLIGTLGADADVRVVKELVRLNLVKSLSSDDRVREIREIVFDDEDPRFYQIDRLAEPKGRREDRMKRRNWRAIVLVRTVDNREETLRLEGTGI